MAVVRTPGREQALVRKTRDILLKHKGKENAISARDISGLLGIKDGDTFINTRTIIDKAIREYALPVAAHTSTPAGYFLIKNTNELYEYMGSLESRKLQIEDKKDVVFWNYVEYYDGLVVEEDTLDLSGMRRAPPRKNRVKLVAK